MKLKLINSSAVFLASLFLVSLPALSAPKCPPQQADLCHELQVIFDHAQRDGILAPAEIKWDGEHLYFDESGVIAKRGQFVLDMTLFAKNSTDTIRQSIHFAGSTPGKDYFQELVRYVGRQIADADQMLATFGYKVESFDLDFTNVTTGKLQVGLPDHLQDQYITQSKTYSSKDALAEYNAHQASLIHQLASTGSSIQAGVGGTIKVPVKPGATGGSVPMTALQPAIKVPVKPGSTGGSVPMTALQPAIKVPVKPGSTGGSVPMTALQPAIKVPVKPGSIGGSVPIASLPLKSSGKQDGPPVTHAVAPPGGKALDPVHKAPPASRDRNGYNLNNAQVVGVAPYHHQAHQMPGLLVDKHKIASSKKMHKPAAVSVSQAYVHHKGKDIDRSNIHHHFITPKSGSARAHNERAYLFDSQKKLWSCSISGMGARSLKGQDANKDLHGHIELMHFQRNTIAHIPANHPMAKGCIVAIHK